MARSSLRRIDDRVITNALYHDVKSHNYTPSLVNNLAICTKKYIVYRAYVVVKVRYYVITF